MEQLAHINGKWVKGGNGVFQVTDPYDGKLLANVADCSANDVKLAIDAAAKAFKTWSKLTAKERGAYLMKIYNLILKNEEKLAILLSQENGKPLAEARGEVKAGASFFEWFAEEGRRTYGETIPSPTPSKKFITIRQPLGVAALICPWNFPIAMPARKLAAVLGGGCTAVMKPAEDTPLVSIMLTKLCEEAGLPPGVLNLLPSSRENAQSIGQTMCESPLVRVMSFTGSSKVGQILYNQCGNTMKKLSLELGGDAPFIVFPSADLDKVIEGLNAAKFRNAGQTCVSANRIFVHESIHDKLVERFCQVADKLKLGRGTDAGVNVGPIINSRQLENINKLVEGAVKEGAKLVKGGNIVKGQFYSPTILTSVTQNMQIAKTEIFGPVAIFLKFSNEQEVIEMANNCDRGLSGYFYSTDVNQCWRVAEALEVGMVGVNESLLAACETPFGGVKTSGLGREGARQGLEEYTELKYICFGLS